MGHTWEYNFSDSSNPTESAKLFIDKIDGTGFTIEGSPEVILWASQVPDDPAVVIVGRQEADHKITKIHEIEDVFLRDIEKECRNLNKELKNETI